MIAIPTSFGSWHCVREFLASTLSERWQSYNFTRKAEKIEDSNRSTNSDLERIDEGTVIPIHRRFGRLALETLPPMVGHLTIPHVDMASNFEQPLEPKPRQTIMEETKPLTKMSLLKSLLSPSTFPHLLMLALFSVAFFVLARMDAEVWSAYGFVAFSLAYLCLAPLSKNKRLGNILRYSNDSESSLKQTLPARLKILALPLVLGLAFIIAISLILGENGILSQVGSFLPVTLGGLFVLWAIAQGRFFGLATMNAIRVPEEGESSLDGYSPLPSLLMTSTLVVVMTFAVTEGLRFFLSSTSFSVWPYLFALQDAFKEAGAKRYIPLKVSGAFHSPFMEPAKSAFEAFLAEVALKDPELPVISNVEAKPYAPGSIQQLLAEQITSPVRWVESISLMNQEPDAVFEEIGPGNVLKGLLRQILR